MKKILGVSFIAMLAVSPMMAMAAGELSESVATATTAMAGVAAHSNAGNNLATGAFVQGAYNEALGYIKNVNASVATLNANVLPAIQSNAVLGTYDSSTTYSAGTIGGAIQALESSVDTTLEGYYTKSEIDTTLSGYVTNEALGTTLEDYATTSSLGTAASMDSTAFDAAGTAAAVAETLSNNYYDKTAVDNKIADFATQDGVVNTVKDASVSVPVTVYTGWATNDTTTTTLAGTVDVTSYVAETETETETQTEP